LQQLYAATFQQVCGPTVAVGPLTVAVSQLSTTARGAPPTMGAAAPMAVHMIKTSVRHLWYLSGTLMGLAFFDSEISAAEKFQMVSSDGFVQIW